MAQSGAASGAAASGAGGAPPAGSGGTGGSASGATGGGDPGLQPTTPAEQEAIRSLLMKMRDKGAVPPPPPALKLPGAELSNPKTDSSRFVVHVPEEAKLWVDEVACPLPGTTRAFNTPTLASGRYVYTLTVESQGRRENRRVQFTPGQTVEVDFRVPDSTQTVQFDR